MTTLNNATTTAATVLVITGADNVTSPIILGGKEVRYAVGNEIVGLTPTIVGLIWANGLPIPESSEEFVKVFSELNSKGLLNSANVALADKGCLRTLAEDSTSGFYTPHATLAGWTKVKDGVIEGAVFKFNLSKIAPAKFPADGAENRNLVYRLPSTATLKVGENITEAGYAVVARFDEEAKANPGVKFEKGMWNIYVKGLRDRDGNAFILPTIGMTKETLIVINAVKKDMPDGGYRYASQAIDVVGTNRQRAGVMPINNVFYLNHPYYAQAEQKAWGKTMGVGSI